MKAYTLPAALLLAASAALLLGVYSSINHAKAADGQLAQSLGELAGARRDLVAVQQTADRETRKSEPADRFLDTWTPRIEGDTSIEEIFGRLDTLAVNNLLSPSGKSFATKADYFFDGRHLPVQDVKITVAGDYIRTLNWLGAVEAAFPAARVEQISYTMNGDSLALAAQFVFPRNFEAP